MSPVAIQKMLLNETRGSELLASDADQSKQISYHAINCKKSLCEVDPGSLKRYIARELYPVILADLSDAAKITCHKSVNGSMESFFGPIKTESLHHYQFKTRNSAKSRL